MTTANPTASPLYFADSADRDSSEGGLFNKLYSSAINITSSAASRLKSVLVSVPDIAVSLVGDTLDVVGAIVGKDSLGQSVYNAYSKAGEIAYHTAGASTVAEKAAHQIATEADVHHLSESQIAARTRSLSQGRNTVRRAIAAKLANAGTIEKVSHAYTQEDGAVTIGSLVVGYSAKGIADEDGNTDILSGLKRNISGELSTSLILGSCAVGGAYAAANAGYASGTAAATAAGKYFGLRSGAAVGFGATKGAVLSSDKLVAKYGEEKIHRVLNATERVAGLGIFSATFGAAGMAAEGIAYGSRKGSAAASTALRASGHDILAKTVEVLGATGQVGAFAIEAGMSAYLIDSMVAGGAGSHWLAENTTVGAGVAKGASTLEDAVQDLKVIGIHSWMPKYTTTETTTTTTSRALEVSADSPIVTEVKADYQVVEPATVKLVNPDGSTLDINVADLNILTTDNNPYNSVEYTADAAATAADTTSTSIINPTIEEQTLLAQNHFANRQYQEGIDVLRNLATTNTEVAAELPNLIKAINETANGNAIEGRAYIAAADEADHVTSNDDYITELGNQLTFQTQEQVASREAVQLFSQGKYAEAVAKMDTVDAIDGRTGTPAGIEALSKDLRIISEGYQMIEQGDNSGLDYLSRVSNQQLVEGIAPSWQAQLQARFEKQVAAKNTRIANAPSALDMWLNNATENRVEDASLDRAGKSVDRLITENNQYALDAGKRVATHFVDAGTSVAVDTVGKGLFGTLDALTGRTLSKAANAILPGTPIKYTADNGYVKNLGASTTHIATGTVDAVRDVADTAKDTVAIVNEGVVGNVLDIVSFGEGANTSSEVNRGIQLTANTLANVASLRNPVTTQDLIYDSNAVKAVLAQPIAVQAAQTTATVAPTKSAADMWFSTMTENRVEDANGDRAGTDTLELVKENNKQALNAAKRAGQSLFLGDKSNDRVGHGFVRSAGELVGNGLGLVDALTVGTLSKVANGVIHYGTFQHAGKDVIPSGYDKSDGYVKSLGERALGTLVAPVNGVRSIGDAAKDVVVVPNEAIVGNTIDAVSFGNASNASSEVNRWTQNLVNGTANLATLRNPVNGDGLEGAVAGAIGSIGKQNTADPSTADPVIQPDAQPDAKADTKQPSKVVEAVKQASKAELDSSKSHFKTAGRTLWNFVDNLAVEPFKAAYHGIKGEKAEAKQALGESYLWSLPVGVAKTVGGIAQETVTLGQTEAKWADGGLEQATTVLRDAITPINNTLQGAVDGVQTVTTAPLAAGLETAAHEATLKSTDLHPAAGYAVNGTLGTVGAVAGWLNNTVNTVEAVPDRIDTASSNSTVNYSGVGDLAKSLVVDTPVALVNDASVPVREAVSVPLDKAGDLSLAVANLAHLKGAAVMPTADLKTGDFVDAKLNLAPKELVYTLTRNGQAVEMRQGKEMWDWSIEAGDKNLEKTLKIGGHVLGLTNPHVPEQYNHFFVPTFNATTDVLETPAELFESVYRTTAKTHNPIAGLFGGLGTGLKSLSGASSSGINTLVDGLGYEQGQVGNFWIQHDTITRLDENTGQPLKDWSHKASNFALENIPPVGTTFDHWTDGGEHDRSWRSLLNIDLLVPAALGVFEYNWLGDQLDNSSDGEEGNPVKKVVSGSNSGKEGGDLIK